MKQKENVKEREQYMNLKRILFILFLGLYLLSCGNKTKSEENKQEEKKGTVENTEKSTENRYGSNLVGYVTKPNDWMEFEDPDSSVNAVQLSIDPVNIITLDIVGVNGNLTVEKAVLLIKKRYLNFGISLENISEKNIEINGYKGKQVTIKIPDGRVLIVNYIEDNGNIYHISQEGLPKDQNELTKVVNTWRPDK